MEVTNNISKEITLNNSIKIGEVVVKGQTAHINRETKTINFSDWVNDMGLYKANRIEIRKLENEFEDLAFEEQDKILQEESV